MLDLFDILGMGGESGYVTVEADDSMGGAGMLNAAGSSGSGSWDGSIKIPGIVTIPIRCTVKWKAPEGINKMGWSVDGNSSWYQKGKVQESNENLANLLKTKSNQQYILNNYFRCCL